MTNTPNTVALKIIAAQVGRKPEDLKLTDRLFEDLDLDSLDIVEVAMEIEDDLALDIPDDDIEVWKTVGDVLDYVAKAVVQE